MGLKDTDIHAGVDVKKRTTRVNVFIVIAVAFFFALGAAYLVRLAKNPPQAPADATPLNAH